jgi:hypothetical protein
MKERHRVTIRLSDQPSPPFELSAFSNIRAFMINCADACPYE